MVEEPEKPTLDVKLSRHSLAEEVRRNREANQAQNERLEEVVSPRIDAQLQACRMAAEQLEGWHRWIADETDLDPVGYSRAAAVWLLAGRSIGFLKALIVLAEAGIEVEAMAIGRALHEADHMLLAFCAPDGEAVVRRWLDDEGKHGYVKPGESRKAQASFEEDMDELMEEHGLPSLGRTGPLADDLYDRMSRVAHSRRSTCVSSFAEPLREFAYGTHFSPLRRATVVEWTSTMTVEVLTSVGDALRAFYGQGFFAERVAPLVHSVDAVRETCPLDEESILAADS